MNKITSTIRIFQSKNQICYVLPKQNVACEMFCVLIRFSLGHPNTKYSHGKKLRVDSVD